MTSDPGVGVGLQTLGASTTTDKTRDPRARAYHGGHPERDQVGLDASATRVTAGRRHRRLIAELRRSLVQLAGRDRPHAPNVTAGQAELSLTRIETVRYIYVDRYEEFHDPES